MQFLGITRALALALFSCTLLVDHHFRSHRTFSISGQVRNFLVAFLLRRLDQRDSFTFIEDRTNLQFTHPPFTFVQCVKDFPHQWSIETCSQHGLIPVALQYCPVFLTESNSAHSTACFVLMISVVSFPLFFWQGS